MSSIIVKQFIHFQDFVLTNRIVHQILYVSEAYLWTKLILQIVIQPPNNVIDAEIATKCTMVGPNDREEPAVSYR